MPYNTEVPCRILVGILILHRHKSARLECTMGQARVHDGKKWLFYNNLEWLSVKRRFPRAVTDMIDEPHILLPKTSIPLAARGPLIPGGYPMTWRWIPYFLEQSPLSNTPTHYRELSPS
ncbi:hypothetical protein FHG87_012819 [Trinorchestia longiramus]|nr:hypothetical protein FHG87_012819 [Trinorchestia longiramus]